MQNYYKPTDNPTLKNYHFRSLCQNTNETFPAFCNRVLNEAKHCHFKCTDANCTAEATAVETKSLLVQPAKKLDKRHYSDYGIYKHFALKE